MSEEITKNEILKVINESTTKTEKRFDDLETAINDFASHVEDRFERVDKRFDGVDKRFDGIETRLDKIEATMVTKDYLDDKLADLRGDLVVLIRKEDNKMKTLTAILETHKVISQTEASKILSMEPFPQNL